MTERIVLASRSPRRLHLLERIGIRAVVRPADLDETPQRGESPPMTALRLAKAKAAAIVADPDEVVVAADTVVALGTEQMGKPLDDDDARRILRRLSGMTHEVTTAVAVTTGDRAVAQLSTTHVRFRDLTDREIDWYVATGEGRDKAGAYGLQGHGAALVDAIHGSHTNVVGLPLEILIRLLRDVGVTVLSPELPPVPTLPQRGEDHS